MSETRALSNLAARCFKSHGPVLHVGGASVAELSNRYGTPLFLYDRNALDRRLDALAAALPHFEVFYSVKANPNLAILRHFVLRGCGLEVASAGEFMQALSAGCRPESIIMAGPGKTEADLQLVLSSNIGEVHVESISEVARIAAIWAKSRIRARVGIRV